MFLFVISFDKVIVFLGFGLKKQFGDVTLRNCNEHFALFALS